jgi:hypothetical protein
MANVETNATLAVPTHFLAKDASNPGFITVSQAITLLGGSGDPVDVVTTANPTSPYTASSLVGNTLVKITALAGDLTINKPTGTFGAGKRFTVRYEITASGGARTIGWGAGVGLGLGVAPLLVVPSGATFAFNLYTDDDGATFKYDGNLDLTKLPAKTTLVPADRLLAADSAAGNALAQVVAPAGDLVGTTAAQTLTNKTASGGSVLDAVVEQALVTISGNTTLTKAAHQGRTLFCTAAAGLTVDNSTDFDQGKGCSIIADGGIVTIVATATVNRSGSKPLTIPRYDAAGLVRSSTADVYILFGGMA